MLTFEPEGHIYRVDGLIVPSVTQVLESVGIVDYGHIPGETRIMALKRGSDVHTICEFDDQSDLDESTVDQTLLPYLAAWRAFVASLGCGFDLIEHRMYSQFGYAGTLDRFIRARDLLIDIKTSDVPWWARIQLAAYKHLIDIENGGQCRRLAVALRVDGTFRATEYDILQHRNDFQTFMAALRVHQEKSLQKK